jgi:hypothetical protein
MRPLVEVCESYESEFVPNPIVTQSSVIHNVYNIPEIVKFGFRDGHVPLSTAAFCVYPRIVIRTLLTAYCGERQ